MEFNCNFPVSTYWKQVGERVAPRLNKRKHFRLFTGKFYSCKSFLANTTPIFQEIEYKEGGKLCRKLWNDIILSIPRLVFDRISSPMQSTIFRKKLIENNFRVVTNKRDRNFSKNVKKKEKMNSRKHCLIFRKKKRNSKSKPSLEKYQFVQSCYRPCTQSPKAVIPACLYFPWKIPRLEFLYSINIENLSKWIKLHQPIVSFPLKVSFSQNSSLVFAYFNKHKTGFRFGSLIHYLSDNYLLW